MTAPLSPCRAWCFLVGWSFRRQARGHLLVWVALGLLGLSALLVALSTRFERWNLGFLRDGRGRPTYEEQLQMFELASSAPMPHAGLQALAGAVRAQMMEASGLWTFSNWAVLGMFCSFLLPLWTLTFATDALARERENRTLLWLLARPLPRPALYLGIFLATLPWCLLLNVGGYTVLCMMGGKPGWQALSLYLPSVFMGTLAFSALFFLLATAFRRPSILALTYAFFLETVAGNLPGYFKRLSLSFYTRCAMYDAARDYGINPPRPGMFVAVSGPVAWGVLLGAFVILLALGCWVFSRKEFAEVQ